MAEQAGIGILGFAHGHVNAYCRQWLSRPELGVRPVAAWDHDRDRMDRAARDHGVEACETADALLARSDVSAVVIATETSRHAELVETAADAGRTIILQKPLALTLGEADRIVAAVERSAARFTLAWQMRVDPQNLEIRKLVRNGTLGRLFMVRRRHGLSLLLNPAFAKSWHVDPAQNRDMWADDAAHAIDFLYWLLGKPESVMAELATFHNPDTPMDNGVAVFRYPGGPLAEAFCSFTNPAGENTTEIAAEKGSLIQNHGDAISCNSTTTHRGIGLKWFLREEEQWIVSDHPVPQSHSDRIAALAEPLAAFVHGDAGPIATAEEGRDVLRMTLACYVSSREGCRVSLDDPRIDEV